MNRVYKVIWSKAKHCYVVTSEIARSVTKSASSARSAGRKGAAVLAMAALLFTAGGVLGEAANVTKIAVNEPGNVITATKDDGNTDTITINNVDNAAHAKEADYATAATKAYSDGNGLTFEKNYAKKTDAKDNLKVGDDGVISKVTGNDGTTSSPVKTLVLNKDGNNPITMDDNGIKVGKNSTVIASDGVFAGGDTAGAAKAALNADGSIKGADGKFEVNTDGSIKGADGDFKVNTDGKVTAKGGVDTDGGEILTRNGNINAGSGNISGKDITAFGSLHADGDISGKDITGKDINGSGTVTGHAVTDGTARMEGGALTGVTTITATGNISTGGDVVSTGGKVQGTSISDGTATLSGGSLTDAVNITASGTITGNNVVVNEKLTTKNLEVTDGLKTDHITLGDETLNQTDINKGNVTSKVNETVGTVEYTAESIFNKDGSSITARTDEGAVDSTGKSNVGAKEISQYLGNNAVPGSSDKNVTRNMVRNGDGTFSMEDKAVDGTKSSTVSQNAGERKVTVTDGTKTLTVTENLTDGIVSEIDDGAGQKVTLTQGMDGTYKVETSGTSTEEIGGQKVENYKGGLDTNITGDETHDVSGTMTTTVEGQATENYNGGLDTNITGDETHDVSGTMTTTAKTVKTITGNNTVTSDTEGTTFKNTGANAAMEEGDEHGRRINTRIFGNQVETGKVLTDFADVNNNLTVGGNTTLGRDGKTTLTVNSKSTFKDTVKMEKTLEVDGTSTFNDKVTITKNGLAVTGGTTTDTLEVKGTSEFGGKAAFKDDVSMDKKLTVKGAAEFKDDVSMGKNLTVTGKTETGTLHVNGDGYVGGDLNVEGNIETHDAELSENSRQVVTGRQLYQTNVRVDKLDNRIKKVGANAAALAALRPGDFNPDDKFSIAAGFGSYRNANAAALGLFYRPNENVLLSLGTSFGDGENMVNAGVSVKFGRGKSMAERRKEMADEVSSMRDEMRSQDERIAELEEMLKKQSELIEKLSKES